MNATQDRINVAIAESLGWKGPFKKDWLREYEMEGGDKWAFCGTDPQGELAPVPNFYGSLDAIVPVIRDDIHCWQIFTMVSFMVDANKPAATATPAQWSEAYLRVRGLWPLLSPPNQQEGKE